MPSVSEPQFVCLPGLTVPLEPLRLLWSLEARGLTVGRDGNTITVIPAGQLTEDERAALRRWRPHVLALVSIGAPEVSA